MRVLVCGGRDYSDERRVFMELDAINATTPIDLIISGGARGADTLAARWAWTRKADLLVMFAKWRGPDGKRAGLVRNEMMLDEGRPRLVVAFPGGSGTAHMMSTARKNGVEVREIRDA